MNFRISIRSLFFATAMVAFLLFAIIPEVSQFNPPVILTATRRGKSVDMNVVENSFRPLWVRGLNGLITHYQMEVASDQSGTIARSEVSIATEEWMAAENAKLSFATVPPDWKAVRLGVEVFDWRNRSSVVWSDWVRFK